MIKLHSLEQQLNEIMYYDDSLDVESIDQWCANGLQVTGRDEISRIGFAVSSNVETFKLAVEQECDVVVVHHSLSRPDHPQFSRIFVSRIKYLANHHLSLFGYHFLLDSHPKLGNNVQIIKQLGARPRRAQTDRGYKGKWSWTGEFSAGTSFQTVFSKAKKLFEQEGVVYPFGPKTVHKMYVGSGGGSINVRDLEDMKNRGVDLYIGGETKESYQEKIREVGMNYIGAGHYATERVGIRALMDKVKKDIKDVEVAWLENWNPA